MRRPSLALLSVAFLLSITAAAAADPSPGCFGDTQSGQWLVHCGESGTTVFCTLKIKNEQSETTLIYGLAPGQSLPPPGRIIVRSADQMFLVLDLGRTTTMTVNYRGRDDDFDTQSVLVMGVNEAAGVFPMQKLADLSFTLSKTTTLRLGLGDHTYSYTYAAEDLQNAIVRIGKCFGKS